jgi:nitrogen fixation protein FixH
MSMSVTFTPNPPQKGSEAITVALKDASGNPVQGARVTIATSMPSMSMDGPQLTVRDNGDGTYTAQTNLEYATDWKFDVVANANGETQRSTVTENVK